jgi:hypothetical protein
VCVLNGDDSDIGVNVLLGVVCLLKIVVVVCKDGPCPTGSGRICSNMGSVIHTTVDEP